MNLEKKVGLTLELLTITGVLILVILAILDPQLWMIALGMR